MLTSLPDRLSRYRLANSGNVAFIFALVLPILVTAVGGAVDYGAFAMRKGSSQHAADVAALAAAKLESDRGINGHSDAQEDALSAYVQKMVRFNDAALPSTAKIHGTLINDSTQVAVEVRNIMPTTFLGIIGIDELEYTTRSVAEIATRKYVDFYFLIDVSESMNIAASPKDRAKLEAITRKGTRNAQSCFFACHTDTSKHYPYSYFAMNNAAPDSQKARLRIDVLNEALAATIDDILKSNTDPAVQVVTRVATSFFSDGFKVGTGPTDNAGKAKGTVYNHGITSHHTNVHQALRDFGAFVGQQGDGDTKDTPRKVAIVATDGVRDENRNFWSNSSLGTVDNYYCKVIKDKDIDLAVLEIEYIDFYDIDNYFRDRVERFYPQISPKLKACASPNLHYVARENDSLKSGMRELLARLRTGDIRLLF